MKKISSAVLFFFMISGINAQSTTTTTTSTTAVSKWRLGLKVMPGISYVKSNKNTMDPSSVGFALGGGLQVEYAMTKTVSFCTGIDIMKHSASVSFPDTAYLLYNNSLNQILSRQYTVQSIDIPLSLKLKTGEIGYLTYWAQVGVLPSIAFKATASNNNFANGTSATDVVDVYSDIAIVRASIIAGLGIEYGFAGSTSLLVGLNYVDGFTPTTSWKGYSKTLASTPYLSSGAIVNPLAQNLSSKYFALTVGLLF